MKRKRINLAYSFDPSTVERPTPGSPPTAFRIWRAGENRFDDEGDGGRLVFSERSAALLLAEQESRNRPYPFDYSHLSLTSESPEAGKAAGWHRLEVRESESGPELWASGCEWVAAVAAGMSQEVPEWRFFSPAFSVDPETDEVVSYINCAVTNNPRTHDLPMLAATRLAEWAEPRHSEPFRAQGVMDPQKALMILADPASSEEDRAAALAVLSALVDSCAAPASEAAPKAAGDAPDDEKANPAAMASIALAKSNIALSKRIEALEVDRLLSKSTGIPDDVRAWAASQSAAVVKHFLASCKSFRPAPDAERKESPTVVEPEKKSGVVIPEVGMSPVDKVLGIRPKLTGKVGVTEPVDGVRRITSVSPSALRNRKGA